jgi:endonuclease-3
MFEKKTPPVATGDHLPFPPKADSSRFESAFGRIRLWRKGEEINFPSLFKEGWTRQRRGRGGLELAMTNTKLILKNLPQILKILRRENRQWKAPVVGAFAGGYGGPFKVLISTVLSLRTKDETTEKASHRLFALAQTPQEMLKLEVSQIEKAIFPVGFYRTKAKNVLKICRILLDKFDGRVPDDIETLLTLPGVGRKTANLTVSVGYGKPGICVDTHVHRICNRWGLVKTSTPDETEQVLRKILPQKYWISFNDLLVTYGQNLCVPISPFCSRCQVFSFCQRKGVERSR